MQKTSQAYVDRRTVESAGPCFTCLQCKSDCQLARKAEKQTEYELPMTQNVRSVTFFSYAANSKLVGHVPVWCPWGGQEGSYKADALARASSHGRTPIGYQENPNPPILPRLVLVVNSVEFINQLVVFGISSKNIDLCVRDGGA